MSISRSEREYGCNTALPRYKTVLSMMVSFSRSFDGLPRAKIYACLQSVCPQKLQLLLQVQTCLIGAPKLLASFYRDMQRNKFRYTEVADYLLKSAPRSRICDG